MTLFEERDLVRWGREARVWLSRDDRRRTIGLIVTSIAISIAVSLIATAVVGLVSRRRAGVPVEALPADVGEPLAEVVPLSEVGPPPEEAVGVPVMAVEGAPAEGEPAQGVGA